MAVCSSEGQTVLVDEPGTTVPCTAVTVVDPTPAAEVLVSVDAEGVVAHEFARATPAGRIPASRYLPDTCPSRSHTSCAVSPSARSRWCPA